VPITIAEVQDIPIKGTSQPLAFNVEYAPNIGFEVLLSFKKTYTDIVFDRNTVTFNAGVNQSTMEVYFITTSTLTKDTATQSVEVNMELIGIDKDIYKLPVTSLLFNIANPDDTPPEITDFQLLMVAQTMARVFFTTSDISTAYWTLCLKGTIAPNLTEMQSQGPAAYPTTRNRYGVYYVGKGKEVNLTFDNLEAETEYVVYVLLYDRGRNEIEAPGYLEFKTLDRYESAILDMRF
jgi:hypothetical protein